MTSSHTLRALELYMFSLDAMQQLPAVRKAPQKEQIALSEPRNRNESKHKNNPQSGLWIPRGFKDKLFWCFYYVWKGEHDYIEAREHAFRIEKEIKISAIERLRAKTDDIKRLGLKLSDVECELTAARHTSYKGLCGLCVAFDVGIIYVRERTYLDIPQSSDYAGLIITQDGVTGVKMNQNKETTPCAKELQRVESELYLIEDDQYCRSNYCK